MLGSRTLALALVLATAGVACQDADRITDAVPQWSGEELSFTNGPDDPDGGGLEGVYRFEGILLFVGLDEASGLAALYGWPLDLDDLPACGGDDFFSFSDFQRVSAAELVNLLGRTEGPFHVFELGPVFGPLGLPFPWPFTSCADLATTDAAALGQGNGKAVFQQHDDGTLRVRAHASVDLAEGGPAELIWTQDVAPDGQGLRAKILLRGPGR